MLLLAECGRGIGGRCDLDTDIEQDDMEDVGDSGEVEVHQYRFCVRIGFWIDGISSPRSVRVHLALNRQRREMFAISNSSLSESPPSMLAYGRHEIEMTAH